MIPVHIELRPEAFLKLEKIAAGKGVTMRSLIVAHIERSLQPREHHTPAARRSRGKVKEGGKRPWVRLTPEQQRELVELTRMGWSLSELAHRYGCSTATINNWRGRLDCHVSNRSRYFNGGAE